MHFKNKKGARIFPKSGVIRFCWGLKKKGNEAIIKKIAGEEMTTVGFNVVEVKKYLEKEGLKIEEKQGKYELRITSDSVVSTDERFTMENLKLGENYKPLDVYFKDSAGNKIRRRRNYVLPKNFSERANTNKTLPLIACQVFENQLAALSAEEKKNFPVCQYSPTSKMICGIYSSEDEFNRNLAESLTYTCYDSIKFVIYCRSLFSTILFVQECLKRFGEQGDQFILIYKEKEVKTSEVAPKVQEEAVQQVQGYKNPYSSMLIESKNVIFRGAPGTGKSYLAKKIAADIISKGKYDDYMLLNDEQKRQIEFVQFHPSYDYTDFVEGLRPKVNDDGTMGFELQDGIFKKFIARARKNYEDSQKTVEIIEREDAVEESLREFFDSIKMGVDTFKTINGNEFKITSVDDRHVNITIPSNATVNRLTLNIDEIRRMLESDKEFKKIKDIAEFFGKTYATQAYSYDFAIYRAIKAKGHLVAKVKRTREELKPYIFIIDEINRGEISKIFGELFFSIDPGYRGIAGEISTQYANLHTAPDEKFYIPENVYIIGTMNDIDRSVDSFDFAMRRRFRFVELKANERLEMLASLVELKSEAIRRMKALNEEIVKVEDLNENYQIGAAYFLKLKTLTFEQLWTDYLEPLLHEYVQGMYKENEIMNRFAKAYGYQKSGEGNSDEGTQD